MNWVVVFHQAITKPVIYDNGWKSELAAEAWARKNCPQFFMYYVVQLQPVPQGT